MPERRQLDLHPQSIIHKLKVIYLASRRTAPCKVLDLADAIHDGSNTLQAPFRYFLPGGGIALSNPSSIAAKVRFAIELGLLDENCKCRYTGVDSTDEKLATVMAQRAKAVLADRGVSIEDIIKKSRAMLRRDTPDLPTADALFHECKPENLSFKNFRFCLMILSYEPDGSLGAYARRLYLARTELSQASGVVRG